jgi:hypothetical protein
MRRLPARRLPLPERFRDRTRFGARYRGFTRFWPRHRATREPVTATHRQQYRSHNRITVYPTKRGVGRRSDCRLRRDSVTKLVLVLVAGTSPGVGLEAGPSTHTQKTTRTDRSWNGRPPPRTSSSSWNPKYRLSLACPGHPPYTAGAAWAVAKESHPDVSCSS